MQDVIGGDRGCEAEHPARDELPYRTATASGSASRGGMSRFFRHGTSNSTQLCETFRHTGSKPRGTIEACSGFLLLLTSLSLFFRMQFLVFAGSRLLAIEPKQTTLLTVMTGAVLGVLVTISSVGAGALGVTALLLLYPRLPMAIIVGSDIAHAVPLTLVAGIGHWVLGSVDWPLLTSLLTGSVPGIILGSYISAHVPDAVLRPVLATTLMVVGGRLFL